MGCTPYRPVPHRHTGYTLLLPDAISEDNGHKGTQILQKSKTMTADNAVKCEEKCFWVDSPISAMLISPYSS